MAPLMPRLPPSIDHPIATATSSTQPTQYTASVHYHGSEPVRGDTGVRTSEAEAIQQLREQLAQQQEIINELREERKIISEMRAERNMHTAADTYRTPISTSVKRVYATGAQRNLNLPRAESPAHGRAAANDREYESRAVGIHGMQLKDILQSVGRYVVPFYADSSKDSRDRTVLEFVENVESVMGNLLMDSNSPHRLMLVQLCLRDGALQWMNRKLQELTDAEKHWRDFNERPLSWDKELRGPFITAHLGTNTAELWLTRLRALKLNEGKTMTTMELDNQFDLIARHAFPTFVAGDERT